MPDASGDELLRIDLPAGRAGRVLLIRPLRPDDADGLVGLYDGLDADDRYRRFFTAHRPPREQIERWCTVAERGGFAVVAVVADPAQPEELVGEAGYARLANGDGEFALTVAAGWRGWLGPLLLDLLVDEARARGVANLEADVLYDNRPMLAVARSRGFATLDSTELTVVHLLLSTGAGPPSWPPGDARPRVLVETSGARWPATAAANVAGMTVVSCGGPGGAAGCPALEGRTCPLVEGADAVVVALRPDDPRTERLVAAHLAARPGLRLVVHPPFEAPAAPGASPAAPSAAAADAARVCRLAARTPAAEVLGRLAAVVADARAP